MGFYHHLTDNTRNVIHAATALCQRFENRYIVPEHLLAVMLEMPDSTGARLLKNCGTGLSRMRASLERFLKDHTGSYQGTPSFSRRSLWLFERALNLAQQLGEEELNTGHLVVIMALDTNTQFESLFQNHKLSHKLLLSGYREMRQPAGRADDAAPATPPPQPEPSPPATPDTTELLLHLEDDAVHAMETARSVAQAFGHLSAEPEHLLFALAIDTRSSVSETLRRIGADTGELITTLALHFRERESVKVEQPAEHGRRLLELLGPAYRQKLTKGTQRISSESLLEAALREPDSYLRGLFAERGLYSWIIEEGEKPAESSPGDE
jgi:ATP-dependent Clp protease ATP-binding subunit ClpA